MRLISTEGAQIGETRERKHWPSEPAPGPGDEDADRLGVSWAVKKHGEPLVVDPGQLANRIPWHHSHRNPPEAVHRVWPRTAFYELDRSAPPHEGQRAVRLPGRCATFHENRLWWAKNGNVVSGARTADGHPATEGGRDPARSDVDGARRFQAGERERPERTLPRPDSEGEMEDTRDLATRKLLRRRAGGSMVTRRSRPSACGLAVSPERVDAGRYPEADDSGDEERSPAIGH